MEQTRISRCINSEARFYGLKAFGIIFGMILMILVWIKTSIIWAMIAAAGGYVCGDSFSKYWHRGLIQKYFYWHLTLSISKLPKSNLRNLL